MPADAGIAALPPPPTSPAGKIAKQLEARLIGDGHYALPLIHRGMVSAHVNTLAGILPERLGGAVWNVADWSRTK